MTSALTVVALAQAIGAAFSAGALLLLILSILPRTRSTALQLWPVLGSEAIILAVGVIPWLLPSPALFVILLVAAARIGFESGSIHGLMVGKDYRRSHALVLLAVSGLSWFAGPHTFINAWLGLLGMALLAFWLSPRKSISQGLAQFCIFPLLPVAAFSHAASDPAYAPLLVLSFFLVEMFDSFSLLGGKMYGRTPLVPRLSPRKTWEGLATGALATMAALLLLVAWIGLALKPMILAGAVVVAAAVTGDLLGSLAKRRAEVKDYPAVMVLQGGLLDITDAWLVAGPFLVALATFLHWA